MVSRHKFGSSKACAYFFVFDKSSKKISRVITDHPYGVQVTRRS